MEDLKTIAKQYAFHCLGRHGIPKFERDVKGFDKWYSDNYEQDKIETMENIKQQIEETSKSRINNLTK